MEKVMKAETTEGPSADDITASRRLSSQHIGIRLLWGIPLGGLTVALLAYGGYLLLIAAIFTGLYALKEFFVLTGCDKPRTIFPLRRLGYIFVLLLLTLTYFEPYLGGSHLELLLVMFIITAFIYQMGRFSMEKTNFLYELAITLLGGLYIGGLLSFAIKLWNLELIEYPNITPGFAFLPLVPLIGAWGYDTSAFFSGVLFGRMKLMPAVSPKKSIEGAIGGVLGSGTAMVIFGAVAGVAPDVIPYPYLFSLGVLLGILCQVGDLCMSALKREMAAKDSSVLIPGHGGVLDKIDGLLFCFPATYYLLSIYLRQHLPGL